MVPKRGLQVLTDSFVTLTDPRIDRTRYHNLVDIVTIAVCGAICGCNSWEDLPRFGEAKRDWFRQLLQLPNGIPSADTFARVFQRLNPDEFVRCLASVVAVLRRNKEDEVVAIDGQTLRGSGDDRAGRHPLHLVRLRYNGNEDSMSMAFYTYSHEKYEPTFFASGKDHGTPEEAFDIGALYLQ